MAMVMLNIGLLAVVAAFTSGMWGLARAGHDLDRLGARRRADGALPRASERVHLHHLAADLAARTPATAPIRPRQVTSAHELHGAPDHAADEGDHAEPDRRRRARPSQVRGRHLHRLGDAAEHRADAPAGDGRRPRRRSRRARCWRARARRSTPRPARSRARRRARHGCRAAAMRRRLRSPVPGTGSDSDMSGRSDPGPGQSERFGPRRPCPGLATGTWPEAGVASTREPRRAAPDGSSSDQATRAMSGGQAPGPGRSGTAARRLDARCDWPSEPWPGVRHLDLVRPGRVSPSRRA